MRISEIKPIKAVKPIRPIKPLSPSQARIKSLTNNIESSRYELQQERERQRRQNEMERNGRLYKESCPPAIDTLSR